MSKHAKFQHPPSSRRHVVAIEPTPQEKSSTARIGTAGFLSNHIGGNWRWTDEAHGFTAEFDSPMAALIVTFLHPTFDCKQEPLPAAKKTRLTVTATQVDMLKHVKFEKQSLVKTYTALGRNGPG